MAGSTIPRRALGRILHDLRAQAGKTQLAAGLIIDVSPQVIGRMEDGIPVKVSGVQVKELLRCYGAEPDVADQALSLFEEVKAARGDPRGGWWRAYKDVTSSHFDHYMNLEEACTRLTTFQMTLLPGLLQTPAYRRAMILVKEPGRSALDVEREIELGIRRRVRLLEDDGFEVNVFLSEAVLRHRVGGPEVMAEQLRHLAEVGQSPTVAIRVVPHDADGYMGLVVGQFTLFEFPALRHSGLREPPVVFVEVFTGALFFEDNEMIEKYRTAVADIAGAALDEEDSRRMMLDLAKEYAA
ncbi:helix-turn-helix domain-containing protein [Nocardia otitidiscaviarum]|uniref:Helix-turn-helix domain-containing protein n=1 Tax=Nocardia otitidiscaviarum TaxID=1823 RepID=A0A516NI69_9NOCA|nr:helix-turn-helix transcriptional regulator [Nocardia otitidiscaviarum]MCP9619932.1 helix-turn-helix domain-containing protein [Nocardia otitidiscaviarum]QDP78586.1 helix-turn-helix domain-containing protein [Nocardia otitidiscaviarum]